MCNLTDALAWFVTRKLKVLCVHAVWNDLHELLLNRSESIVVCFISFCLQRTYGFTFCVSGTCNAVSCLWWVLYLLKFNISEKSRSAKINRHFYVINELQNHANITIYGNSRPFVFVYSQSLNIGLCYLYNLQFSINML